MFDSLASNDLNHLMNDVTNQIVQYFTRYGLQECENVGATMKQRVFLLNKYSGGIFLKEKVAHFPLLLLPPHSLCIWRLVGSGAHSS